MLTGFSGSSRRFRWSIRLGLVLFVLVVAPAAGIGFPSHPDASVPHSGSVAASTLRAPSPWPIPLFPLDVHPIGVTGPATVDPTSYYSSEPAPMGIGDFGVGAGGHPYTYSTTEFLGNFSWIGLNLNKTGDNEFTDQLNVVLQFTQGAATYAYWIQDVAFMNSSSGDLQFEDNIWNFTNSGHCLANSALSGNGTVYALTGCEGYYAVGAFGQPGSFEVMPSPGDFSLLVRSYLSAGGEPEVAFEYYDGVTSYEVPYDNVVWPWARAVTSDHNFYVDGNATAPSGNFYDAELTLGGPGGGAATIARTLTDATSRLFYWNGHNFEATRAVWNFGSDTAEAISNVQSVFSNASGGTPQTSQLNGTAHNATPGLAYDEHRVGVLSISAPSLSSGTVSVDGTRWSFQTGAANLTLVPGTYQVWVNSSAQHDDLGTCEVVGGQTTMVNVPGSCFPSVSVPTGAPGSVDIGQSVVFQTTLTGAGSGGDSYSWGPLAAGLGCTASVSSSVSCRPTTAGSFSVAVTVTDSDGQSNSSGTLHYTVDTDPAVGSPGASPSTVETGALVTFTAAPSGGSGGYAYAWSGLPNPCTAVLTASPTCHPMDAGGYTVSVNVTDSNGGSVVSPAHSYTVEVGPRITVPVGDPAGPVDLGQSVNFSATVSGGAGPYTYVWDGVPTGCASANVSTLACTPTASGHSTITVAVTDSVGGGNVSGGLGFTVNAPLEVSAVSSTPRDIDLGENVTLTAVGVSGGGGSLDYVWANLPAGCVSVNSSSLNCRPSDPGSFYPALTISDPLGGRANGSTSLLVSSDPSVGGISPSRASADVGQALDYSLEDLSGGSGVYSFAWTGLPAGCSSMNSSVLPCTPNEAGSVAVTVSVSDSNHGSTVASMNYSVDARPTVTTPSTSLSTVVEGQELVLATVATDGSGDLAFSWTGLPGGCVSSNNSTLRCTPNTPGEFSVSVTVKDSNGVSAASRALALTVNAPSPAPGSTEPLHQYLWIVGVVIVVVALVALAVWVGRRK
jgi:hypothetical protein